MHRGTASERCCSETARHTARRRRHERHRLVAELGRSRRQRRHPKVAEAPLLATTGHPSVFGDPFVDPFLTSPPVSALLQVNQQAASLQTLTSRDGLRRKARQYERFLTSPPVLARPRICRIRRCAKHARRCPSQALEAGLLHALASWREARGCGFVASAPTVAAPLHARSRAARDVTVCTRASCPAVHRLAHLLAACAAGDTQWRVHRECRGAPAGTAVGGPIQILRLHVERFHV